MNPISYTRMDGMYTVSWTGTPTTNYYTVTEVTKPDLSDDEPLLQPEHIDLLDGWVGHLELAWFRGGLASPYLP